MDLENNFLESYLISFFTNDIEKNLFKTKLDSNDFVNSINKKDWIKIEKELKSFLPCGNLDSYNIKVNRSASDFIKYLLNTYVDDNTCILGVDEHYIIRDTINTHRNSFFLTKDIVENFDIDIILQKYKQTHCNKFFVYVTGMIDTTIIPQSFYIKLKKYLVEQNIEHIMIMDDIQSMFIIPRNYSIFDYVLFTTHSLIPTFKLGMIFSKKDIDCGFIDEDKLKKFLVLLKFILNKYNKFCMFNNIMYQYFAEELIRKDLFKVSSFSIPNGFYIWIINEKIKNYIQKYKDELLNYHIELSHYIGIKSNFIMEQDISHTIEGFKKLKVILNKAIQLKNKIEI